MTWLRKNPLFGAVLIAIGALLIAAAALFYTAQSAWGDASARYATDADELMRLQRLTPFPTGENVRKMKAHAEEMPVGDNSLAQAFAWRCREFMAADGECGGVSAAVDVPAALR